MKVWTFGAALALACGIHTAVHAADWPNRPVRMLVGSAPGGGTDAMARAVADRLGPLLDFLSVLIKAGQIKSVVAHEPLIPCEHVCCNGGVGIADM